MNQTTFGLASGELISQAARRCDAARKNLESNHLTSGLVYRMETEFFC